MFCTSFKYKPLIDIDISKTSVYNNNLEYEITSSTLNIQTSTGITLSDYQLTEYDYGRTSLLIGSTKVLNNNKLIFNRIKYNKKKTLLDRDSISISPYDINLINDTYGKSFELRGGYLTTNFKLHNYPYEFLPSRYNNGITFSTWIRPQIKTTGQTSNDGIFLYMGLRAENKYSLLFTGSTENCSYETTVNHSNCLSGETTYLTSLGNKLDDNQSLEESVYGNNIAFILNNENKLGFRYINDEGELIEMYSDESLPCINKWTNIIISFKPNTLFTTDKQLECGKRRKGKLSFYVNGREFISFDNFDEFYFKPLKTTKEKQINIPYTLSWGGGTFGLKHSYHFDPYWQKTFEEPALLQENGDALLLETVGEYICNNTYGSLTLTQLREYLENFCNIQITEDNFKILLEQKQIQYKNFFTAGSNGDFFTVTGLTTSGQNQLLSTIDLDESIVGVGLVGEAIVGGDDTIPYVDNFTSLMIYNQEGVGFSSIGDTMIVGGYQPIEDNLILFTTEQEITIQNNRKYVLSFWISEESNILLDNTKGDYKIKLNNITGDSFSYYNEEYIDEIENASGKWKQKQIVFITKEDFITTATTISLYVDTDIDNFNIDFVVYVDEFKIWEYYIEEGIYSKDIRKDNLLIERYFDGYFHGQIQKLKIYDKPLTFFEVKDLFDIEKTQFNDYSCSGREYQI